MLDANALAAVPQALGGERYHLDLETRSALDVTKVGVQRYVRDPTTGVWLFSYGTDHANIRTHYNFLPDLNALLEPTDLLDHIENGGEVCAHHAQFEYYLWNWILVPRRYPHWPKLRFAQMNCTMARAAVVAFPMSLEKLADVLELPVRKDKDGANLMRKMAKPAGWLTDGTPVWHDSRENQIRLGAYCEDDVGAEMGADEFLPELTPDTRETWLLDQEINERGYKINVPFIERAAKLVQHAKKKNDAVMRQLTNREVPKCSQDQKLITWLNKQGVEVDSLAKGERDHAEFLAEYVGGPYALDAVKLRNGAWKTSTAKYVKCLEVYDPPTHRIMNSLQMSAASTGRWGGRLNQPQNYKRVDLDDIDDRLVVGTVHELLSDNSLTIAEVYDGLAQRLGHLDVLDGLSKCLRSTIIADDGNVLYGGDFSNIEGRFNAWVSGEAWKVQAFLDFDRGVGDDLYKLAYAASFNVPPSSVGKGAKRQIGKVQELSLGYQGSVNAYITMGANYGVNPFELAAIVHEITDAQTWDRTAAGYYSPSVDRCGLQEREWTALKILVNKWRAANPNIVQGWWDLQDAAIEAVAKPYTVVNAYSGKVQYYSDTSVLWCILPSGRMLSYYRPQLKRRKRTYVDKNGETKERWQNYVTFYGTDSKTKQWREQALYGGLQCENIVQAGCVDLLIYAMKLMNLVGFPIVLTVHDEIVAEVPLNHAVLTPQLYTWCMSRKPVWARGLPVAAGTWEDVEYVK